MANKRVYRYLSLGTVDSTTLIKTPNGPSNFTVFTKSVVIDNGDGGGAANLTIDGSFVSAPASEDLVSVKVATDVSAIVATEYIAEEANRFPYLQVLYEPTIVNDDDITTEVYIGFY